MTRPGERPGPRHCFGNHAHPSLRPGGSRTLASPCGSRDAILHGRDACLSRSLICPNVLCQSRSGAPHTTPKTVPRRVGHRTSVAAFTDRLALFMMSGRNTQHGQPLPVTNPHSPVSGSDVPGCGLPDRIAKAVVGGTSHPAAGASRMQFSPIVRRGHLRLGPGRRPSRAGRHARLGVHGVRSACPRHA